MFLCLLEHPVSISPVIAWEQGWSPSDGYQLSSTLRLKQRKENLIMSRYEQLTACFFPDTILAVLTFPPSVAPRMVSLLAACTEDGERWACRMLLHVSILRFRRMRVWALFPVSLIWNKRETSTFEPCIPRTSTDTASFSVQKQSYYLCTDVLLVALHSWFVFVCSFFRRANLVWSMWPSIVLRPARLQHVWMMNEHVAACCSWFNVISPNPFSMSRSGEHVPSITDSGMLL